MGVARLAAQARNRLFPLQHWFPVGPHSSSFEVIPREYGCDLACN